MTKYLAGVLSVIAVGVLLIAWGLLAPRTSAYYSGAGAMQPAAWQQLQQQQQPYPYGSTVPYPQGSPYGQPYPAMVYPGSAYPGGPYPVAQPIGYTTAAPMQVVGAQPVQTVVRSQPRRTVVRTVERAPGRDWKKTALVIGGSTAAGAGLGGIFGGKKGALIGAAIGGGASTIYETTKR